MSLQETSTARHLLISWDLLDDIHKKGNTVIVVTHEEDIARHAARIIRLFDGEVAQDYVNPKYKKA